MIGFKLVAYCETGHCEPQRQAEFVVPFRMTSVTHRCHPPGWGYMLQPDAAEWTLCCAGCMAAKSAQGWRGPAGAKVDGG